ncbi:MAG: hypothetical protein ACI9WV_002538 [Patiriisocius sp.]|jgi:hypothetical protein
MLHKIIKNRNQFFEKKGEMKKKYQFTISTYIYCVKNCFPIYLQT